MAHGEAMMWSIDWDWFRVWRMMKMGSAPAQRYKPIKLMYSNDAVMVVSHRIKQPFKMGFKRGNRL